ncbi:MAG: HD domain-containing protein [Cellvibrionales bacterium]|nr:HD domain-containing protein [Cellvibrionales bacterium]
MTILNPIRTLFNEKGELDYGEGVTQLAHALQCAYLAEKSQQTPAFITACLLHDIGHFITPSEALPEADYAHEKIGAQWLKDYFSADVTAPITLHVEAKRYLCAVDASYRKSLSDASHHSLQLQGGQMSLKEVSDFQARKYNKQACLLRQYDDLAKETDCQTPSLDYFIETYVAPSLKEKSLRHF